MSDVMMDATARWPLGMEGMTMGATAIGSPVCNASPIESNRIESHP